MSTRTKTQSATALLPLRFRILRAILIGLVLGFPVKGYFDYRTHSYNAQMCADAKRNILYYQEVLEEAAKKWGRYPTSDEGLDSLVNRPKDMSEALWHGPFIWMGGSVIHKDPWGNDYVYRYPGIHNTNRFDLYSLGPNGKMKSEAGDNDAIGNW